MEDKGLALMQMLNKKAVIDDEDPENRKIDENIANKMEEQDYEIRRRERKAKWQKEEALRKEEEAKAIEEQKAGAKQSKVETDGEKPKGEEEKGKAKKKKKKGKGSGQGSSGQTGSDADSFASPKASDMTLVTKGTQKQDESFETRIFGKRAMTLKKRTKSLEAKKEQARKKKEELEKKKKEEEEKKRKEEEDKANEADVESDHHGRIYIDYREPRPSAFPQ